MQNVQILLQKVELLSTFWKDFSQPAQPNLLQDRFASWVVKRASSFCSNVVKQVARFYARFTLALGKNELLPFPFKYLTNFNKDSL